MPNDFNHEKETVQCEIEYCDDLVDGEGRYRNGVRAICTKCGNITESFGQSEKSIRRCLAIMCEECPNDEENWYEEE